MHPDKYELSGSLSGRINSAQVHACNCIGPQNGQPRCPCMMRNIIKRDGRWVQIEQDLGPATEPSDYKSFADLLKQTNSPKE